MGDDKMLQIKPHKLNLHLALLWTFLIGTMQTTLYSRTALVQN